MASYVCMRNCFAIIAAVFLVLKISAADTNAPESSKIASAVPAKIGTKDVTNYYDQTMIVTGKVVQVTIRPTITYLNLDEKFPNSPFAVVIFHGKSSFYGDANALKGKTIEVRGKIKNYKDKPEMSLDSTNQLTVLGVTNLSLLLNPRGATTTNAATASTTNAPPSTSATNTISEIF